MYQSFEPIEALSPFVECYWTWQIEPGDDVIDDILPDAAPELIVHLANPPHEKHVSGEWVQQPGAFLFCSAERTLSLRVRAPMKVFAIRFRPWGVSRFSRRSMAGMLDRAVLPAEALGGLGDELVAGLLDKDTHPARIELANRLLGNALQTPARDDERLKRLLDAANGGRSRSAEMAQTLAMSDRSFNRLWSDIVGIQPRRFIQLMRFHNALSMINAGKPLATVAADCGYSDQAHMARQISAISGMPPTSLRRRLGNAVYRDLYAGRPGAPWQEREKTGQVP